MLFHGTPGEVYRKCGKPNCKCVEGGTNRHGPYSIIRIFRDGKNTQITVIEEDQELLKMAERYQEQVKIRKEIEVVNKELSFIIDEVTQKRLLKDYKKA